MSNTPILTPPPKKPPTVAAKASLLPQGLAPVGQTLKHYSTWVWGGLLLVPDYLLAAFLWVWHFLITSPDGLYAAAMSAGMLGDAGMPPEIMVFIRWVSGIGLVAKFISQRKQP